MRPLTYTLNPDAASTTKVAAAQTVLVNGSLTLTAAASAIDSSGAARILLITTTEDDSSGNLTITGTNANGGAISEVIAMPNSTTKVTTLAYKSVSSITTSIAITANISIGTVGTVLSAQGPILPLDFYDRIAAAVAVQVTGTINYTVKETFDPILSGTPTLANAVLFSVTALAAKTSNTESQIDVGATGVVIVVNSYSTGATLTARIISPANSNQG